MENIIGATSAATLGYITGGIRGAKKGLLSFNALKRKRKDVESYPKKKMPPIPRSRATKKKRYLGLSFRKSLKKKPFTKKRKRVTKAKISRKRSKAIKGIVKRVIECDFNHSTYQKSYGQIVNPTGASNVSSGLPVTHSVHTNGVRNDVNGATGTPTSTFNLSFTPFNIYRLLDAASVLYNGKTPSMLIDSLTNSFEPKGLTVNFQYCSYKIHLRNVTTAPIEIEIQELSRKVGSNNTAYEIWQEAAKSVVWKGTAANALTYNTRPQQYEKFNHMMKTIKCDKIVMLPGASKTLFYKFEKTCVDFNKYLDAADPPVLYKYPKGIGRELMIISNPMPTVTYDNISTPTLGYCGIGASLSKRYGLVVVVDEFYKIQQPDETIDTNEGNFRAVFNDFESPVECVYQQHTNQLMPNIFTTSLGSI